MNAHGGDVLVEMLIGYGVPAVFGLVGGQTLPLHDGIRSRGDRIRHIAMRDECNALYAADGYSRLSGRVGVADATVGPGAIKFVSGLAEAYNSSTPIVAVVGDMQHDWITQRYRGGGNQLVDQLAVLDPLTKWTGRLPSTEKIPELVRRAFQHATSGRPGPVVIELAEDLLKAEYTGGTLAVEANLGTSPTHRPSPDPTRVTQALKILTAADRPVMLVGGGVWLSQATAQITKFAEAFSLPVATSLSGKGALPEDHPLSLGVMGALGGSSHAQAFVEAADVIVSVGFKFAQNPTYRWALPTSNQTLIQVDIDPAEMSKTLPAAIELVADARATLIAFLASGLTRRDELVVTKVGQAAQEWSRSIIDDASDAVPIKPQQVAATLDKLAPADTVLVSDASFASGWAGMYFTVAGQRRAIFPRGMSGLGWGLPAAIGAKVARPSSRVVALVGDGALGYCVGELATLQREALDLVVVVLNNNALGWTRWEQALFWDGRFQSTDLSSIDFATVAKGFGCTGIKVEDPTLLPECLSHALTLEGPVVVDVRTSVAESAASKFFDSESARQHMKQAEQTS